ncbi:OmpA family protein [Runella sp.]|uniref:OmpA family protein n=1 Tax=Runella sp. TaxID=1960881 RepID=UPI003D0CEE3F
MKTLLFLTIALCAMQLRAQHGLQGEYYNGRNFDEKVLTRTDPQVNFSWRGKSPGPNVKENYFSVRWTGKLVPPLTGVYQFAAKVDDGVRIWVGGKLIVDAWGLHDTGNFRGNVKLEKGKIYDLKIDYFNAMLEGEVQVYWKLPNALELQPINTNYLYKAEALVPKPIAPKTSPPAIASKPAPKVASPPKTVVKSPTPKPVSSNKKPTTPKTPPVISTPVEEKPPVVEEVHYPSEKGKATILENVTFEQSSYLLLPSSYRELDRLAEYLQKNPTIAIEIAGHTDNVGDPRLNLALSENRAKVVRNYLVRKGISEERIISRGYGGTRPLTANTNETERAKNRRVELVIH